MRRTVTSALLSIVLIASPVAWGIQPQPSASIDAGGHHYIVSVTPSADGKTYEIGGDSGFQVSDPEFFISLSGEMNPDPQIDYGLSVTDFGAPSSFSFTFSMPIALPAGPNTVAASISGGLNDVHSNGAFVTPTLPDSDLDSILELQVTTVSSPTTDIGVDVGQQMILPPGTSGTQTYGSFNAGPQAGPPGPWTMLTTTVAFNLSGDSDIFTPTGHAEINVPEPTSLSLLALTIIPLLRRRRPE